MADPDWSKQPLPLVREDVEEHQEALANVPTSDDEEPPPNLSTDPVCLDDDVSAISSDVFSPAVYRKFCLMVEAKPEDSYIMVADAAGNAVPKRRRLRFRREEEQYPPPGPDEWKGYKFSLSWSGGGGDCERDCSDMFKKIADSPCKWSLRCSCKVMMGVLWMIC